MSTNELAASYAALILADDGIEITVRGNLSILPLLPNVAAPGRWTMAIRGEA